MAKVQDFYTRMLVELSRAQKGQGLVEYALIIVLVSIVAMVSLQLLGVTIDGVFAEINGVLGGGA